MKACDICGAQGGDLVDLLDTYKTSEIKEICRPCEKVVNDHLWKVRAVTTNMNVSLLQRFMHVLRGEKRA